MRITSSDILDFLTKTLVPPEIYPQQVLSALSRVFGFESTVFWTGCNKRELLAPILSGIQDRMLYDYCDVYKNICPLYPTNCYDVARKNHALTINDLRISEDPKSYTDIYGNFAKKYSTVPLLSIYLFDGQQSMMGAVGINRRPDERELQESERDLLRVLGKHISNRLIGNNIYGKVLSSNFESPLAPELIGTVIVDRQLNIVFSNSSGIEVLRQVFPQIATDNLVQYAFHSLVPPIKLPIIANEERILALSIKEAYRLVIEPLANKKMDSENLYMISIFRGPSTRDDYNQNSQIKSMYNLTNREYEIVSLLQKGYSNEQIAEKLCITPRTVKAHLHSIFEKTGVNTRGKLIYKLS